jgi:hypothetical protein
MFPGQKIVALIEATGLVCIERFKDYPQLGRFTLRDEGVIGFFFSIQHSQNDLTSSQEKQ